MTVCSLSSAPFPFLPAQMSLKAQGRSIRYGTQLNRDQSPSLAPNGGRVEHMHVVQIRARKRGIKAQEASTGQSEAWIVSTACLRRRLVCVLLWVAFIFSIKSTRHGVIAIGLHMFSRFSIDHWSLPRQLVSTAALARRSPRHSQTGFL